MKVTLHHEAMDRQPLTVLTGVLLGVAMVGVGCGQESSADRVALEAVGADGMSWEEYLATVEQEPGTGIYIVDGDIPIYTVEELQAFYLDHVAGGQPLIVNLHNGNDDFWSGSEAQNLSYCVSTAFGSDYGIMVNALATATAAWETVADVDFVHSSAQDSNCTASNNNVLFDVRPACSTVCFMWWCWRSCPSYYARAFFPHESRANRNILVSDSAMNPDDPNWPGLTLTGIMRHELGHALGFRHEHTRPEANTCFEDNDWRQLTAYDQASVMHYPWCNGTGDGSLDITDTDAQGAATLYGAPTCGGNYADCFVNADCCDNRCVCMGVGGNTIGYCCPAGQVCRFC